MIIAAPIASEARAAISHPADGAKAAARDDTPNSMLPIINNRLNPMRSPSAPIGSTIPAITSE